MSVDLEASQHLSGTLITTFKTLAAHKRRLPRPHTHADQGALPLLYALDAQPLRISALAEAVHSDVSTVSRQVSTLTAGDLVTKVCDTQDRRAQLVTLTDEGRELVARLRVGRAQWIQSVLADWSTEEVEQLDRLLQKFTASFNAHAESAAPHSTHVA